MIAEEGKELRLEFVQMYRKGRIALLVSTIFAYIFVGIAVTINLFLVVQQPLVLINIVACGMGVIGIYAYYQIGVAVLMMRDRMSLAAKGADPQ